MLREIPPFALPAGWGFQNDTTGPPYGMPGEGSLSGHACTTLWTG